jgi:hypothetical protein
MQITIRISAATYEKLLDSIPQESTAYTILRRIVPSDANNRANTGLTDDFNGVVFRCTHEEVLPMLGAAKQHCPAAVKEIESALWPGRKAR